jgi:hypothetical protein
MIGAFSNFRRRIRPPSASEQPLSSEIGQEQLNEDLENKNDP